MSTIQQPMLYINGFPKAGTHMIECFARQILVPAGKGAWFGSFKDNSWSNEWLGVNAFIDNIDKFVPGVYAKGHCGYRDDIANAFYEHGVGMVFIFRDMRDVAISQAHHIIAENDEQFQHPAKGIYRSMASFEDVLLAVINGVEALPGLWQRWRMYAPWLSVPWVLNLRYEDVLVEPMESALLFLRYAYGRAAAHEGKSVTLHEGDMNKIAATMVEAVGRRDTATYRQGIAHAWEADSNWTPKVEGAFQANRDWFKRTIKQDLENGLHNAG